MFLRCYGGFCGDVECECFRGQAGQPRTLPPCVAQIFSHRFTHPAEGDIMNLVAGSMPWNKRKGKTGSSKPTASSGQSGSEIRSRNKIATAPAGPPQGRLSFGLGWS